MIEKAGVLYFRFFCYLYVLFSFVLIQKKVPKKKSRLRLPGYSVSSPAKGQKLASLKQSALLNAGNETSA